MFFDHLKQLCADRGTTPTALARKVGISTSNVTSWKNGASPKLDMVERLADALQVPVSALCESQPEPTSPAPSFSAEEMELVEVYRKLDNSGQRRLFGKAYELLDAQEAPKAGEELSPPDISVATAVHNSGIKK